MDPDHSLMRWKSSTVRGGRLNRFRQVADTTGRYCSDTPRESVFIYCVSDSRGFSRARTSRQSHTSSPSKCPNSLQVERTLPRTQTGTLRDRALLLRKQSDFAAVQLIDRTDNLDLPLTYLASKDRLGLPKLFNDPLDVGTHGIGH